jgi:hypothetical protein
MGSTECPEFSNQMRTQLISLGAGNASAEDRLGSIDQLPLSCFFSLTEWVPTHHHNQGRADYFN